MTINKPDTLKLLPPWMRDDQANRALATVMDGLIKKPGERAKSPRVWDKLDLLTDAELDEMAWELDIDWWVSSWEREQKIPTIRMASEIMQKRGTKWAVEQLAVAAFGLGEVTEWYEYGGEPYYFKILTSEILTPGAISQIVSMIDKVKNARSHLEAIGVARRIDQKVYSGCAQRSFFKNVILEGSVINSSIRQAGLSAGTGQQAYIKNTIH